MNAFWKFRNIPKKYYQFPEIKNGNKDASVLVGNYYQGSMESDIVTGRSWRTDELRLKSSPELHKLYYVLLKEKLALKSDLYYSYQKSYMNNTVNRDLAKVQLSMSRLLTIVRERDQLRNDFMTFLEFYYIRKQQTIEKGVVYEKVEQEEENNVIIKGRIEDQSKVKNKTNKTEKAKSVQKGKVEKPVDENTITVLSEKEIIAVHKLKKTYSSKNTLLRDYVKNPQDFKGKQKRKLFSIVQRARAKTAKEIFTKELAAIAYKLKNSKI
jgi:large subunit ribosomal protein L47